MPGVRRKVHFDNYCIYIEEIVDEITQLMFCIALSEAKETQGDTACSATTLVLLAWPLKAFKRH